MSNTVIEIFLISLFLVLPALGISITLFKLLLAQIKMLGQNNFKRKLSVFKIILNSAAFLYTITLILTIVDLFLVDIHMPVPLIAISLILFLPYLVFLISLFYALGSAVAFGGASSVKILNYVMKKEEVKSEIQQE